MLVIAAGDDLSYPDRVSKLAREWQETGADALTSNWDVIDEFGRLVRRGRPVGWLDLDLDAYFPGRTFQPITGATSAYSASVFRNIPPPPRSTFCEDLYLSLMLHWRGRTVRYVPDALVQYRRHATSLSHFDRTTYSLRHDEQDMALSAGRNAALLQLFAKVSETQDDPGRGWGAAVALDRKALAEDIAYNLYRADWMEAGLIARLFALARFQSRRQLRWLLPRTFGLPFLALLKKIRQLGQAPFQRSTESRLAGVDSA